MPRQLARCYIAHTSTMITLIRTTSDNPDFQQLVFDLNVFLAIGNGANHAFFAQFNHIDRIPYVVLAYQGKKPVGSGALKPYSPDAVEIKRMFVPADLRGQGIGSRVVHELECWARELGFQKCILETGSHMDTAIRLYEKNQFSVIPNYGPYVDVAGSRCFEKKL